MKIDLTKREWEFLHSGTLSWIQSFEGMPKDLPKPESLTFSEQLLAKLGSEWIDEDEEMRKFHEGFAYFKRSKTREL